MILQLNKNGEFRRHKFTIRPGTATRRPLALLVVQRQTATGEITACTLTVNGKVESYIESAQYAQDLGQGLISASTLMREWDRDITP